MKNNRLILPLLAVITAFLTFANCNKNSDTSSSVDAVNMKNFLDKNAPKTETFSFTATQSFKVTTTAGTIINFPANVLVDAAGQLITGNVTVSVREAHKPSEMLLSDKPTVSSEGTMLVTFGEIKVDVVQNGKALKIRDTVGLAAQMAFAQTALTNRQIPMWVADTTATTVSSGLNSEGIQTTVTTSVPAMKGATWLQISGGIGAFGVANTTTNQVNFNIDKLGEWRNCDVLYSDVRPKTTLLCYFSTNFNPTTTSTYQGVGPSSVFFKPKNQATLIKLYSVIVQPTAGKEGFYSYLNTIPIGMEGSFLAMSTIDGKFYVDTKDVVIAAPASGKTFTSITFSPVEVTEADLLAKITALNSK